MAGIEGSIGSVPSTALVPIAHGSEEIESVTIIDTLVRAGIKVTVASCSSELLCIMSRGVKVQADVLIEECVGRSYGAIICPGGMPGAEHLRDSKALTTLLKAQRANNGLVGAICAAPAVVLHTHDLLPTKKTKSSTCYPAPKFIDKLGENYADSSTTGSDFKNGVVVAENVITSQGPGTSLDFALTLVHMMCGRAKAEAVGKEMLHRYL